eukprot:TRINITY_DN16701_c0_g1_i1.p1 TRINITY_DN16701_c0_g1~~TRINITY_DN16701_c0_g1_i1.p1  ORF type:complete len:166 (-),score=25.12 TRINITY_DN16701_c0_g1_i1:93-590(-)
MGNSGSQRGQEEAEAKPPVVQMQTDLEVAHPSKPEAPAIQKGNVRQYTYIDGCNNDYSVNPIPSSLLFVYRPIRPEESSSGRYSGGDPVQRQLTTKEWGEWEQTFERIWKTQACPTKGRNKGQGILIVHYTDNTKCELTLKRSLTVEFDALGHQLRGVVTDENNS